MNPVALTLILELAALGGGPTAYDQAYSEAQANGRPLLVLVGAQWCPGCRTMKQGVLARMDQQGRLGRVNFALVDTDAHGEIAGQLMRGGMIPQLIAFSKNAAGQWHREQITGATSEAAVESLIERAVAEQARQEPPSETVRK